MKPELPSDIIEQVRRGEEVHFPAWFDPDSVRLPANFYFAEISRCGRRRAYWLLHIPSPKSDGK
jgi:hypothetical protein